MQKTALLIMSEDVNISPVIYLDEFYMQMSSKSFEEVLKSIWEKCEETGLPEYKGQFRYGKYNGKGTLYNEDSSIRKKGNFKNEEPDADEEAQKLITVSNYVDMTTAYETTMQEIIEKYNLDDLNSEENQDNTFYYDTEDYYEDDNQMYSEYDEYSEDDDASSIYYGPDYILLASDEEPYTEEDLEQMGLSEWECRIARNEIYARYGKIFQDEELQAYFEQMYWYHPREDFSEDELTDIEKHNLEVIVSYEKKMGYQ